MSGFPRWHTETAIRGRKPGGRGHHGRAARAEEEGGQRGHEAAVCVLNSLKDAFILWHAQVMQARVRQALETNNYFRVEFKDFFFFSTVELLFLQTSIQIDRLSFCVQWRKRRFGNSCFRSVVNSKCIDWLVLVLSASKSDIL